MTMRIRLIPAVTLSALLALAIAVPVAGKEFGTIYVDTVAYRTFGNPARVDPGTGTDPIISFTNFDQGGVALHAPGPGSHGGRWAVTTATWVDPENDARLVTDYEEVLELAMDGLIVLDRVEEADFRCPILPNG
jgi:ABC-type transport system substrate-binding protein